MASSSNALLLLSLLAINVVLMISSQTATAARDLAQNPTQKKDGAANKGATATVDEVSPNDDYGNPSGGPQTYGNPGGGPQTYGNSPSTSYGNPGGGPQTYGNPGGGPQTYPNPGGGH
ncbi:hypothetical protein Nepgr_000572 [Nepenthes gracilis]|uniref:Uncharacterized protein n=1 Tax=Nepenthes gracilis TaxID=150966 RepID=A0AAD3P5I5_NEPGR|nr:hypothetical protein Nepgr_000572 [Nepenthes gracilis]